MERDEDLFDDLKPMHDAIRRSLARAIVGQEAVIEALITALFAEGHCLFVGVPGLAKTLLVASAARATGLAGGRVQFTPDLLPGDVTGGDVMEEDPATGRRSARFVPGPVFCNLLLADEVNRAPPRTQSALLQVMQERCVTVGGRTTRVASPFHVFATQNPIEQEGTWPLPEAQLDRFLFSLLLTYPTEDHEAEMVLRTTVGDPPEAEPALDAARLVALQGLVRRLPLNRDAVRFGVRLAAASRPGSGSAASRWLRWGAGPRASQALAVGSRAWAALRGREVADADDVRAIAPAVLRHRLVLGFDAEASGRTADDVVRQLLEDVAA
jgi:MoxR-like ATPase